MGFSDTPAPAHVHVLLSLRPRHYAGCQVKGSVFGGTVSDETRREAYERLTLGLQAVAKRVQFAPYVLGAAFTAADCVAYVHFTMVKLATTRIYAEDLIDRHLPEAAAYMRLMDERPHVRTVMAEREAAMATFVALNVPYDG